jgi:hypothetical protein
MRILTFWPLALLLTAACGGEDAVPAAGAGTGGGGTAGLEAGPGGGMPGAGGAPGGDASGEAGAPPDAAGSAWMWEKVWPGLVLEPTAGAPVGTFELPIPDATVSKLEMSYSVEIGEVVDGNRHQFSFTCADHGHPYRGGLFGFLFLQGQLGKYVFRNGRPGEGATEPTKIAFSGTPSTEVGVVLRWDGVVGTASIEVTDPGGAVASVTSTEKVEPTPVPKAITVIFGFDLITQPNPAESASIGWKYRDLVLRAAP